MRRASRRGIPPCDDPCGRTIAVAGCSGL